MQPYLFPYFPYLQLFACVDIFVIFDTAQFIRRGWANRNQIELEGHPHRFVFPVHTAPRHAPFSDILFAENVDPEISRFTKKLIVAHRRAPYPGASQHLLAATFPEPRTALTPLVDAFERMCFAIMEMLSFRTEIVRASDLLERGQCPAQDYIIELTKKVGGVEYINPYGGARLYDSEYFIANGLKLSLLNSNRLRPEAEPPTPNFDLSILHALAYRAPTELFRDLHAFDLE